MTCGQPGPLVFYETVGTVWANVGQSYATANNIDQTFIYGTGQSSSLGVGISATGASGTFSAAGTVGVSTTSTYTFPTYTSAAFNHWQSKFVVGLYYQSCNTGGVVWYVRPYAWAGGTGVVHPTGAPATPYCVPILNGTTHYYNTTTATTFSVGYSALGFNGSAQTGYTTTAAIKYVYHIAGVECGAYAYPGQGTAGFLNAAA